MSATMGVRSAMVSNSSMVNGMSNSRAMASRCITALVDPPVAATDATALSMARRSTMSLGITPSRTRVMIIFPASSAAGPLAGSVAGMPFRSTGESPRNSDTMAMVLAVNWPPQAPAPGQAAFSMRSSSSSSMVPLLWAPMPSNTSCTVMSRSL